MITYSISFIRHGMTKENLAHCCVGGRTDTHLCAEGIEEIKKLKKQFGYPTVGKLYVSPMLRTMETADLIYPHMSPDVVWDLKECDMGIFDGKSISEIKDEEAFQKWVRGEASPPEGETPTQLGERVTSAFEEILKDMMEEKINSAAVVTHGLVMMSLLTLYGYPKRDMSAWATPNGCGFTVRTSASMWMRDGCFEVVDTLPMGKAPEYGFFGEEE